jgi:hypothetical protein
MVEGWERPYTFKEVTLEDGPVFSPKKTEYLVE